MVSFWTKKQTKEKTNSSTVITKDQRILTWEKKKQQQQQQQQNKSRLDKKIEIFKEIGYVKYPSVPILLFSRKYLRKYQTPTLSPGLPQIFKKGKALGTRLISLGSFCLVMGICWLNHVAPKSTKHCSTSLVYQYAAQVYQNCKMTVDK